MQFILKFIVCFFLLHTHDDVIKWKQFPRYWSFVRGIDRSPVNSPHKGQWCGALMFPLISVWINAWINNREAGDLRRCHDHYDVTVMYLTRPTKPKHPQAAKMAITIYDFDNILGTLHNSNWVRTYRLDYTPSDSPGCPGDFTDTWLQTVSNAFSWMKMYEFRLQFQTGWSLFLRFQLTIFQHWFRYYIAWRRPGDKPLSEPMMVSLLTHICATRPQWVKQRPHECLFGDKPQYKLDWLNWLVKTYTGTK